MRELADGRVLVADKIANTLQVVDFRTGRVRSIARVGGGPGEYRAINSLFALGGDSTLVEDRDGGRWLVLHGTTAVQTVNAYETYQPRLDGADCHGRILELRGFRFGTPPDGGRIFLRSAAESLVVIVSARSGAQRDTITRIRGAFRGWHEIRSPFASGTMVTWTSNPMDAEEQALLFCDGWIAAVLAEPYRVIWYPPRGEHIIGPPLPFERVAVTEAQKRVAIESSRTHRGKFTVDQLGAWPRYLPPFFNEALLALPDGRVAVRRAPDATRPGNRYDLIDRTGALSAVLTVAANQRVVGFSATAVYVATTDSDLIERLSRHPWP